MINFLLSAFENYGLVAVLFIGAAFFLLYLVKNYHNLKGEPKQNNNSEQNTSLSLLIFHPFFSNVKYRISVELPALEIFKNKPVRQQLYIDFLRIYLSVIEEKSLEIAKKQDEMNAWTVNEWIDYVGNTITDINTDFKNKALANGIDEIVIQKFNDWNLSSNKIIFDYIKNFGNSHLFADNIARTNTLFYIFNLYVVSIIADAEKTLKYLNGDISGKYYNGKVIEP